MPYVGNCANFIGINNKYRLVCKASPDGEGIPSKIAYGKELQIKPFAGDHGVQFRKTERKMK